MRSVCRPLVVATVVTALVMLTVTARAEEPEPPAPQPQPVQSTAHASLGLGGTAGALYGIAHGGGEARLGVAFDRRSFCLALEASYARLGTPYDVGMDLVSAGLGAMMATGRLHLGLVADLSVLGFSRGIAGDYVASLGLGTYGRGSLDLLHMDAHVLSLDARAGAMFFAQAVVPEAKAGLVFTY
jgi:hypothetical protein